MYVAFRVQNLHGAIFNSSKWVRGKILRTYVVFSSLWLAGKLCPLLSPGEWNLRTYVLYMGMQDEELNFNQYIQWKLFQLIPS